MKSKVDIKQLQKKLTKLGKDGVSVASVIVQSQTDLMVADVKRNAPADMGKLRQSAGKDKIDNGLAAQVFVNAVYAAYVEFGTGAKVDVPAELQDIAIKFKGKKGGSWQEFEQAMIGWVHRHGIDEKFVYIIMIQIIRDGLAPRPFFYPAYIKVRKTLPELLIKGLTKLANQQNA